MYGNNRRSYVLTSNNKLNDYREVLMIRLDLQAGLIHIIFQSGKADSERKRGTHIECIRKSVKEILYHQWDMSQQREVSVEIEEEHCPREPSLWPKPLNFH